MNNGFSSNLTMATMPGVPYLMPTGISGLSVGMPGQSWSPGGDFASNLYADLGSDTSFGQRNTHPYNSIETDSQGYVSTHFPIATKPDGSHAAFANSLFKHCLCFLFRETPTFGREPKTIVPIYWLNIFLSKQYNIGCGKYDQFLYDFMEKNKSFFPGAFKDDISNFFNQDNYRRYRDDFDEDVDGNSTFAYGDSDNEYPDSGGNNNSFASMRTNTFLTSPPPMTQYAVFGPTSGRNQLNKDNEMKIKTVFTKFTLLNMPPAEYLFTNLKPEWISSEFFLDSPDYVAKLEEMIRRETIKERDGDTITLQYNNNGIDIDSNDYYISKLSDQFDVIQQLKIMEKSARSADGKNDQLTTIASSSLSYGKKNISEIINKPTKKSLFESIKEREEKRLSMIEEIIKLFQEVIDEVKIHQLGKDPGALDYLLKGAVSHNWVWAGVANTITDDTGQKHAYGNPVMSFPLVKVVVARQNLTYNIWGANLSQYTSLYLLIRRRPLRRMNGMTFSSLNQKDLRDLLHKSINNLNIENDIDLNSELAWSKYGAYEIVPYENGRNPIKKCDLAYLNIFGQIEYPTVIEVGITKYDYNFTNYNNATVNIALGLPNEMGILPLPEDCKKAMMSLPHIDVLFRMVK